MKKKNWIQSAIKRPGAFTAKAKRAGKSVSGLKNDVLKNPSKYSTRTVKQANLANTLSKFQTGTAGGSQYSLPTYSQTTNNLMGLGEPAALQAELLGSQQQLAGAQEANQQRIEKSKQDAEQASKQQFNTALAQSAPKVKSGLTDVLNAAAIAKGTANAGQVASASKDTASLLSNLNSFGATPNTMSAVGGAAKAMGPGLLGAGLSLAGAGIQRASDDKDATTMNFGETAGTLMKGAGTGLGVAGGLAALGATGVGLPLAAIGALGYGIHGLVKRNKARKEKEEIENKQNALENELSANQADAFNRSITKTGSDMGFNVGNSMTNAYLPGQQQMYKKGGEMIKRADGSYSQRGLWDNIRANKGSGKEPTKEMLKQEKKIKKMQAGNSPVAVATPPKNVTTQDLTPPSNFTQRLKEHNSRPDSFIENVAEFFDPTGVSSWDDAYRSYNSMKARGANIPNSDEAINMFGALPGLGKFAYLRYLEPGVKPTSRFYNWQKAVNRTDAAEDISQENLEAGGMKVPGGKVVPMSDSAVKFVGKKHNKGGILLDPNTEVEGGETMDKVQFSKGNKGDYIFSDYLKLGGRTFASRHKEMVKKNASQADIQNLAKMQEEVAKSKGRTENGDRGAQYIAKMGGIRKFQTAGNPTNESYSDVNFNYSVQPKNAGNIPMQGDVDQSNWRDVFNTPWAQRLGLDSNMSQEDLIKYYKNDYMPMIQNMPDEVLIQRAKAFADSGDVNAKYIAKQFNPDGSIKPNGLRELRRLATDTQVGPYHAIFIDEPTPQPAPTETPKIEETAKVEETPKTEPKEEITPPETPRVKSRAPLISLLGLAGLAVPNRDPYPGARLTSAETTGKVNLPRINLNAERAANAAQTTAFNRQIGNQMAGPGGVAAMLGMQEGARKQALGISNQESQANKQLMAQEAGMNSDIAQANANRLAQANMFNARQMQERDINQYDQRLYNKQLMADTITGVGRDYMTYRGEERLADSIDDTNSYMRLLAKERMQSLIPSQTETPEATKTPDQKKTGGYIKKLNTVTRKKRK